MTGNPVNRPDGRNLGEKSHTAKDSIETIEDDMATHQITILIVSGYYAIRNAIVIRE